MEAVSKASDGRARCAATGRGARSPRVGSDGRNVLATDHPRPLWGSWCPVETHAAWPSIHSEKTCGQDGQISNGTNDSFQAKSNKLSMVWVISLFKKINAGIFKSKNENKSQWVFNLCSIHIRKKRSTLSKTAFDVKQGHQTHGSLAGTLPPPHSRYTWIMDHCIVLFATEPFSIQCSWQLQPINWCQLAKWNLFCSLENLSILVLFCYSESWETQSITFLSYETNAPKFLVNKQKADMASKWDYEDIKPPLIFTIKANFSQLLDLQKVKIGVWDSHKDVIYPHTQILRAASESWFHNDSELWG